MARKNESPQKATMKKMMHDYLKNNDISIKSGTDVNSVMRDMMPVLLEGALDKELDEELGCSRYDYRNKNTDNSRNRQDTAHYERLREPQGRGYPDSLYRRTFRFSTGN